MNLIVCLITTLVILGMPINGFAVPVAEDSTETAAASSAGGVIESDETRGGLPDTTDSTEAFMIAKELEGTVKEINGSELLLMSEGGAMVPLVIDRETVIYINEQKCSLADIRIHDDAFAYYIEENGVNKCDWIEITR